jgi:hypothetical protein
VLAESPIEQLPPSNTVLGANQMVGRVQTAGGQSVVGSGQGRFLVCSVVSIFSPATATTA